jgi:hypothetical protein
MPHDFESLSDVEIRKAIRTLTATNSERLDGQLVLEGRASEKLVASTDHLVTATTNLVTATKSVMYATWAVAAVTLLVSIVQLIRGGH